jgi:uncharacterized protein involved in high-affinity Fe2+ transport
MKDWDGPAVARGFYEALMAQENADEDVIALAADITVRKLRRSGFPAKRWVTFLLVGV